MCDGFWNFMIQVATALGSVAVAVLAIWGDYFRHRFARPNLSVTLRDRMGDLIGVQPNEIPVRYYHLVVNNSRKWSPAHNVFVHVTDIQKLGANGLWQRAPLSGPVPLEWQYGLYSQNGKSIGPDQICDLGAITRNGEFRLAVQFLPNNFGGTLTEAGRMRVTVVARGDTIESQPAIFEVAWDGQWEDGASEMANHFVISQVNSDG